jgi:hypothetical protein
MVLSPVPAVITLKGTYYAYNVSRACINGGLVEHVLADEGVKCIFGLIRGVTRVPSSMQFAQHDGDRDPCPWVESCWEDFEGVHRHWGDRRLCLVGKGTS